MGQHIKKTYFTNCPCTWSISSLVLYSWEKRKGRGGWGEREGGERGREGGEGRGGERGEGERGEGGGDGTSQLFMDLEVSDVLSSASL